MVEVDVTEWGAIDPETGERQKTTVFVREMTARELTKFQTTGVVSKNRKFKPEEGIDVEAISNMRERLVIATCCDADGNLIFKPEDINMLGEKPVAVLERIVDAALKINNLKKSDLDEEETVKN